MSLSTSYDLSFASTQKTDSDHGVKVDPFRAGAADMAEITRSFLDTNAVGITKLSLHYHKQLTLVATVAQTINLFSHTDEFGTAQSMTLVKVALFRIVTPVASTRVTVAANASSGWFFHDITMTAVVRDLYFAVNAIDGWTASNSVKNVDFTAAGADCVLDVYFGGT